MNDIYRGSTLANGSYYLRNRWDESAVVRVFTSRVKDVIKAGRLYHLGFAEEIDGYNRGYNNSDKKPTLVVDNHMAGAQWMNAEEAELPEVYKKSVRPWNNETDLTQLGQLSLQEKRKNKQDSFVESFLMIAGMVTGESITRSDSENYNGAITTRLQIGDKINVAISVQD